MRAAGTKTGRRLTVASVAALASIGLGLALLAPGTASGQPGVPGREAGARAVGDTSPGAGPATGTGTDYFVSPDGSDGNDGRSTTTAFQTLQQAANAVQPGDTVYVMDGTYTGGPTDQTDNVVTVTTSGTAGNMITFKPYPGAYPVIEMAGHRQGFQVYGGSYIRIEGLTIHGDRAQVTYDQALAASRDDPGNQLMNETCIYVHSDNQGRVPAHVEIVGNHISDCTAGGIGAQDTDYTTITGNVVHSTSWWTTLASSGISLFHSRDVDDNHDVKNVISNNVVYDNETKIPWGAVGQISDGNGIIVDDNRHTQDTNVAYNGRTLVENNLSYDNGGGGVHTYSSQHVDVVNNTAYHNSRSPALNWANVDASESSDVTLLNNIAVALPEKVTISGIDPSSDVRADYNVFAGGTNPGQVGPHDLADDPEFVTASTNPDEANFALTPGSPAAGSGTSELAPATDLFGNPRPAEQGVDRGAIQSAPYPSVDAARNTVGVTDDTDPAAGNFDPVGYSYSAQGLAGAGLTPGAPVTVEGITAAFPSQPPGTPNVVTARGQTIALTGRGSLLLVGAATYHTVLAPITVSYSDGTTSQVTADFADWYTLTPTSDSSVLATVGWNQPPYGLGAHQVSIYSQVLPLAADRDVRSITLPDDANLHFFVIAVG